MVCCLTDYTYHRIKSHVHVLVIAFFLRCFSLLLSIFHGFLYSHLKRLSAKSVKNCLHSTKNSLIKGFLSSYISTINLHKSPYQISLYLNCSLHFTHTTQKSIVNYFDIPRTCPVKVNVKVIISFPI